MTDRTIEPERYELNESPLYDFEVSRREFLGTVGGGIFVLCMARVGLGQDHGGKGGEGRGKRPDDEQIGAWLHIDESGTITAYTGKVEMGQGTRTSLTQVVAEELRVPVSAVALVMGDTDRVPYDRGTWGSRSTPTMVPQLRKAARAARLTLVDLAAKRWKTGKKEIRVRDGRVFHPDGKTTLSFGDLTRGETLVREIGAPTATEPPADRTYFGSPVDRVNARAIVTGSQLYASDLERPGMVWGKILRPPSFGATIASIDTGPAEAIDGVTVVRDKNFVGVTAPDEPTAEQALTAIDVEWKETSQVSHRELFDHLVETADAEGGGWRRRRPVTKGSVADGLKEADTRVDRTYTVSYIAHAPIETRSAIAEWTDGKLQVWTGTQAPFRIRSLLARTFGLSEDEVRVQAPDTGGAYGGKTANTRPAIEAARLAKEAKKPVKLVWTREEEFTWAYFRPAGVITIEAGVKKNGRIHAWRIKNYNSGASALSPDYTIPNQDNRFLGSDAPLRQGSYRALAATANVFAQESHIDDLAHAIGADPLDFRIQNLDDPRLIAVLKKGAERFGWKEKRAEGKAVGLACAYEKESYIATFTEVSVDERRESIRVDRVVACFECGAIVNPKNVESQVEGAIIMALGGALYEEIQFEDGRILNPRFSQYRVPRFRDVPEIETVLLDRPDLPSEGAGETPLIALAPAIGNAVFAKTNIRLTTLPLLREGLK